MNLKYELTTVDYINFNEYHFKTKSNFFQKNLRFILFFVFLIYMVFSFEKPFLEEVQDWSFWVIFGVGAGLLYFLDRRIFKSRKSAVESAVKRDPTLIGRRELFLEENKIIIEGEGTKFEYNYNLITSIEEDNSLIYIYLSERNAILVPKRSTGNIEFLEILKSKIS